MRDRNQCMNCGKNDEQTKLDVHHIVPRGQGGSDRISNLVLLCRQCHDAAHEETMAPTVDFSSTGKMKHSEFEIFREFFEQLPSARFDTSSKKWRVPIQDMQELVDSIDKLPIAET